MESSAHMQHLKSWMAERDARDAAPPLTPTQIQAIIDLTAPVPDPEPDLGEKDWISILQRFRDSHPAGKLMVTFAEAGTPCSWESTVRLDEAGQAALQFPPGPAPADAAARRTPTFARKKDAKRYAAKLCVEWLVAQGRISPAGMNAFVLTKSKHPGPAQVKVDEVQVPAPAPRDANAGHVFPSPPMSTPESADGDGKETVKPPPREVSSTAELEGADGDDVDMTKDIPATQKVVTLSKRLGYPMPRYEVTPVPDHKDYFTGHVVVGPDQPTGKSACRVTKTLGKRGTKERIASLYVSVLEKELEERRGMMSED